MTNYFKGQSYLRWTGQFLKVAVAVLCLFFVSSSAVNQKVLAQAESDRPFITLLPFISTASSQPTSWQVISAGTNANTGINDHRESGQFIAALD